MNTYVTEQDARLYLVRRWLERKLCWFKHDWVYSMKTLTPTTHYDENKNIPICFGWKQCTRCAKSKVTLVLR